MRSFTKEDSGVSVLMEYILTIIITSVLFTMLIMNLGSIMAKSDRIVMGEQMDITANIVANQLADFSNELRLNDVTLLHPDYAQLYSLSDAQLSERTFNVPKPYGNKQYSIEVKNDNANGRGIITVTYLSDTSVCSVATFNSPVPIQDKTIYCNSYNLKVSLTTIGGTEYMALEEMP